MKIEAFDGEARLIAKAKHVTEAQRIRAMPNAYSMAIGRCVYRHPIDSGDHLCDKKIFHFEDGSYLVFEVSYAAAEDGMS